MQLLDTDICIHLLNAREPELIERLRVHLPTEIAICSIVRAELLWGARRSRRRDENLLRVQIFTQPFLSLPFDDASAGHYGAIRASRAAEGQPIGPNDALIAAIARAHDAMLVTRNVREFSRVSGLEIEPW